MGAPGLFADLLSGPPLGFRTDTVRSSTTVALPAGGVIVFYTDGLIERRGECLDEGMERLRGALSPSDPEIVCRQIAKVLLAESIRDDVAIVVVRRSETLGE